MVFTCFEIRALEILYSDLPLLSRSNSWNKSPKTAETLARDNSSNTKNTFLGSSCVPSSTARFSNIAFFRALVKTPGVNE